MKIVEALFEIAYLLFAVTLGIRLIRRPRRQSRLTGLAALTLGCGDAFHLVPRIIAAFAPQAELTAVLGLGKFVTSVTMTAFYLFLEIYRQRRAGEEGTRRGRVLSGIMFALFLVRCALCFLPHNAWMSAEPPLLWGVIRNVPFVIMGGMTVALWAQRADRELVYRRMAIAVTLSFLFYLPVVLFAGTTPAVGMLMLPKTLMYVWILLMFRRAAAEPTRAERLGSFASLLAKPEDEAALG